MTDFFKSQHGGRPHTGLKIADIPGPSTETEADTVQRSKQNQRSDTLTREDSRPNDGGGEEDFGWALVNEVQNRRFNASERWYNLTTNRVRNVRGNVGEILGQIGDILRKFLEKLRTEKNMEPQDFVRLVILSPELRAPIAIPWVLVRDWSVEAILEMIERVLQSNQHFYLHPGVTFVVKHVHNPHGGKGGKANNVLDSEEFCKAKGCIIRVKNKDDMCFAKAVVKGLYRPGGPLTHPQAKSIQNENNILDVLAKQWHARVGVPEGRVTSREFHKFQAELAKYKIRLVIYSMRYANATIFDGMNDIEGAKEWEPLFLYHYDNHFAVITSIPAFVNSSYFCFACLKAYDHKESHECEGYCSQCRTFTCDGKSIDVKEDKSLWIKCDDCLRSFRTDKCFEKHKVATCAAVYICGECSNFVDKSRLPSGQEKHSCTDFYCVTCSSWVIKSHECFMERESWPDGDDDPQKITPEIYVFYDFECEQVTGIHKPNLLVASWTCTKCLDISKKVKNRQLKINACTLCRVPECDREIYFKGPDAAHNFCNWLFATQPDQFKLNKKGKETSSPNFRRTVIAHNSQGYDLYFILNHMIKNGRKPTNIIRKGGKLLYLTSKKNCIRFIDSMSFLPMSLAKLTSAFQLPAPKGTFPHYFNTFDNFGYKGPMPDPEKYGANKMMPKARAEFLKWHSEQVEKGHEFDFDKELLEYCRLDVKILQQACVKFRELFMKLTSRPSYKGIDPFKHSVTLASACNLVYRSLFLQNATIALIPPQGYHPKKNYSKKALQWLHYESVKRGCHIQHAINGGEVKIGGHYVDGWCEETKTVFMYQGCRFHGCPCQGKNKCSVTQKSMASLYQQTLRTMHDLTTIPGITVVEMWEHEFDKMIANKKSDVPGIVADASTAPPLDPREAFFGGRVNALKLFHEVSEGEKIFYYDYTSLYPSTNKYARYPSGKPTIIYENFDDTIDDYFGLIQCDVLPPTDLYIPVLPCKTPDGKLTFALCKTCAFKEQQTPCKHANKSRIFRGVWVSEELKKAVELGYTIIKIHEVWHFEETTQYDPETQKGGLFAEYINTFLKVKQESSGWPQGVKTAEEKDEYIKSYFEHEGIQLDSENIEVNPGLRTVSKLCLNTLWGKFGQAENMPKTEYINSPARVLELLGSGKYDVDDLIFHNEHLCEAHFRAKTGFADVSNKTNVVIAAFTTAWARLKLYSVIEKLNKNTLYMDTDSVLFVHREGEYLPPLGNYLGELTNEIDPKDGSYIKTFVSGGPKNYGFCTDLGKTFLKVRGITLNHDALKIVNFDTLRELVKPNSKLESVRVPLPGKITRDVRNKEIVNKDTHKDYRVVYTKRVREPNGYDTLPYGFRK